MFVSWPVPKSFIAATKNEENGNKETCIHRGREKVTDENTTL
jgi:hypothetical protein